MTSPHTIRILGIDPGSRATGFGVIEQRGNSLHYIASGVIRSTDSDFNTRLRNIYVRAGELLLEHAPDELAIERVFVKKNADSALKLGAARAAVLCSSFQMAPSIHEYAAREIKQALTGKGSAEKEQVQSLVRIVLGLGKSAMGMDESDALAIAICHANTRVTQRRIKAASA